jgi:hypothetical protein
MLVMHWGASVGGRAGGTSQMDCNNCRRDVSPNAEVCPHCGEPGPTSYWESAARTRATFESIDTIGGSPWGGWIHFLALCAAVWLTPPFTALLWGPHLETNSLLMIPLLNAAALLQTWLMASHPIYSMVSSAIAFVLIVYSGVLIRKFAFGLRGWGRFSSEPSSKSLSTSPD